jgi:tetratricopeptide (TPR) repeat protein
MSEADDDEPPPRRHYAAMSDAPPSMGRRRSVGGFIVAAVVLGCVLMVGAVWVQKNGLTFGMPKSVTPTQTTDPRVATFLTNGEKALGDGNLDLAKESLDKASALAERDPHVLLDVARLAAARADVMWLKSRLLPNDAADEQRITHDSLGELSQAARKAADDALAVAPEDPAALRAKIDALRISGDRDAPRPLVDRIKGSSAQPETAYVLAALDLADVAPLWSTVIDRLKIAAAVESGPGRARAALVYALARSGNGAAAKEELDRLKSLPRQHVLVPQLAAFVEKARGTQAKGDAGAPIGSATMAATEVAPDPKNAGRPGAGGGDGLSRDPRALVAGGEKARLKGDYENAKRLYNAAVEINPNDSEALAGLGAVAYAQRDLPGARSYYKRVLSVNPNYTPALVGLGDVEWDSGDRSAAMKIYRDIVDRVPEGAYPARVKQRTEAPAPAATPAPTPTAGGDRSDQGGN